MGKLNLTIILLVTLFSTVLSAKPELPGRTDELSPEEMKRVTSEMLDIFISGKTGDLQQYISHQWLKDKNINISEYKISSYSPVRYYIAFALSNVCVAMLYCSSWTHLLVFKFTDENGTYRVIPRGINEGDNEYIDPWWDIEMYVCEHKGK
jgi:hypothetical protein